MKPVFIAIMLLGFGAFQHSACNSIRKQTEIKKEKQTLNDSDVALGGPVRRFVLTHKA